MKILIFVLSFFTILLFGSLIYFNFPQAPQTKSKTLKSTVSNTNSNLIMRDDKSLFDLIQRFRYENYLNPYKRSDLLCRIADIRLSEIQKNYSHEKLQETVNNTCSNDCSVSENLMKGMASNEDTLKSWLNSTSHSAALRANYTHSCLKCYGLYCVQIFGYY